MTQQEHILHRPDSYVGSTEPTTQELLVFDEDEKARVVARGRGHASRVAGRVDS